MDTKKWQQIEKALNKALDLSGNVRNDFLTTIREEDPEIYYRVIEQLDAIEEAEDTHFLEYGSSENEALFEELKYDKQKAESTNRLIGNKIGPFTLTEFLGRGGMAVVYKGERKDGSFNQTVAVKILNKNFYSAESMRRFRAEQQILSRLNHPNIARMTDGGITDEGNPYLIMEYVDGVPISEYCKNKTISGEDCLSLFKDLCAAVKYAHRNMVVHRDLKPDNILVTDEGKVKVLDFSIAKLLDEQLSGQSIIQTQTGVKLLSPNYCAPEQFRDEPITTSTDVFALGLLLYELATGQKAVSSKEKTLNEIQTIICTTDFSRASTINADVDTELEAIIHKALRKEPEYRYDSAGQMLEDLERYEQSLPLIARGYTLRYRTRKFIKRHRASFFLGVVLLITLSVFIGIYTFQMTKERNQAQAEADKAEMVTSFLIGLFEASDPTEARGDTVTARELLDRGLKRAEALRNLPGVQSQMFETIGRVYRRLGQYQQSHELLGRALKYQQDTYGINHTETAGSLDHLGMLLSDQGAYSSSETMLRQSLQIRTQLQSARHPAIAETQNLLAYSLRKQGKYDEAEKLYRASLQIRKLNFGDAHPLTVASMSSLGTTLHNMGDYNATEKIYREVLELNRRLLGPVHPDVAMNLNNLGALLMNVGQFEEAGALLNEALTMRRQVYGSSHPKVALTMNNLAMVLTDLEQFSAAESLYNESVNMRMELLGSNHVATAISQFGFGKLMFRTGRPDSALTLYTKALVVFRENLTENHSFIVRTQMRIGSAKLALGYAKEAEQLLEEGFKKIQEIHSDSSLEKALAEREMGIFYFNQGQLNRADSLFHRAYATLRYIEGTGSKRQDEITAYLLKIKDQKDSQKLGAINK